jgi:hypothetical protein
MTIWQQTQLCFVRDVLEYWRAFSVAVLIVRYVEPVVVLADEPLQPSLPRTVCLAKREVRASVANLQLAREHREVDLVSPIRKRVKEVEFLLAEGFLLVAGMETIHDSDRRTRLRQIALHEGGRTTLLSSGVSVHCLPNPAAGRFPSSLH